MKFDWFFGQIHQICQTGGGRPGRGGNFWRARKNAGEKTVRIRVFRGFPGVPPGLGPKFDQKTAKVPGFLVFAFFIKSGHFLLFFCGFLLFFANGRGGEAQNH